MGSSQAYSAYLKEQGRTVFKDLTAMQNKFEMPEDGSLMSSEFLDFRFKFQLEELIEMDSAIENKDAAALVDSLIDQVVVAVGTLNLLGVDSQAAWDEVLRANMSKQRGTTSRSGSGGADLVKPEGWEPPNLSHLVTQPNSSDVKIGFMRAFDGSRTMPHSISVLLEAISLQLNKDQDYNCGIPRAAYWIGGLDSFEYELNKKNLRFRSVLAKLRRGGAAIFETLEDTLFDKIVYAALAVSWLRKKEPGQPKDRDLFNK